MSRSDAGSVLVIRRKRPTASAILQSFLLVSFFHRCCEQVKLRVLPPLPRGRAPFATASSSSPAPHGSSDNAHCVSTPLRPPHFFVRAGPLSPLSLSLAISPPLFWGFLRSPTHSFARSPRRLRTNRDQQRATTTTTLGSWCAPSIITAHCPAPAATSTPCGSGINLCDRATNRSIDD